MYICICKQITDKQIIEAVDQGADFPELQKMFGLASSCGSCLDCVHELIAEHCVPVNHIKIINSSSTVSDLPPKHAS